MEDALAGRHLSYNQITSVPFDAEEVTLTKRDGEPGMLIRNHLADVTLPDLDRKVDVVANLFEDGNSVLHLPITGVSNGANLAKRFDGAGFKVSYTTRIKTKLIPGHQREMATYLAHDWGHYARTYLLTDIIGFASVVCGASIKLYYRIVPELEGCGFNYESVYICGGMFGLL